MRFTQRLTLNRSVYPQLPSTGEVRGRGAQPRSHSLFESLVLRALPRLQGKWRDYELAATVSHHGASVSGGHYTARISTPDGWVCCDDAAIRRIHPREVFTDNDVYLLAYVACEQQQQ